MVKIFDEGKWPQSNYFRKWLPNSGFPPTSEFGAACTGLHTRGLNVLGENMASYALLENATACQSYAHTHTARACTPGASVTAPYLKLFITPIHVSDSKTTTLWPVDFYDLFQDGAGRERVCRLLQENFRYRQHFLECCGDCGQRFHCKCINVTADEYDLLMASGRSKNKWKSYTRRRNSITETPPSSEEADGANETSRVFDAENENKLISIMELLGKVDTLTATVSFQGQVIALLREQNEELRADASKALDAVNQLRAVIEKTSHVPQGKQQSTFPSVVQEPSRVGRSTSAVQQIQSRHETVRRQLGTCKLRRPTSRKISGTIPTKRRHMNPTAVSQPLHGRKVQ